MGTEYVLFEVRAEFSYVPLNNVRLHKFNIGAANFISKQSVFSSRSVILFMNPVWFLQKELIS